MNRFESRKTALLFEGSGWENEGNYYRQELEKETKKLIKECKDTLLKEHQIKSQKKLEERLETFMQE